MATAGDIDVYVKMPSGRSAQYDVKSSFTIKLLCGLIAKDENIPATQVRLKYQGKTLDGTKSVGWYGVRPETILKVDILIPRSLDLVIELPEEAGTEEVVISNLEPVTALYERVAEILGEDKSKLKLKIVGKVLASSASCLMDAGVSGGSTVTVEVSEAPGPTPAKGGVAPVNMIKEEMDSGTREEVLSSFDAQGRNVEVVFSFDTTGSMYSYLTQVRKKLKECCRQLLQSIPNIRIGIMAHGDYCDEDSYYVIKQKDLTSDMPSLIEFSGKVGTTSGGDCPECYEWVLKKAQQLDWSEDSAKALVVIGDAEPHPPSYTDQSIHWRDELDVLTGMDVKVYGVQAGNNNVARGFYQELADVSGGCYVTLAHIDVITDMFLAVCYRESDEAALEDFEEQVESRGEMTEAKKEMFTQLKQTKDNTKSKAENQDVKRRYVFIEEEMKRKNSPACTNCAWWDVSKDITTQPLYTYNEQEDKWSRYTIPFNSSSDNSDVAPINRPVYLARSGSQKKKSGKKCIVM